MTNFLFEIGPLILLLVLLLLMAIIVKPGVQNGDETTNEDDRYGPQTAQIEAILERVRNLTGKEAKALSAAWESQDVSWDVSWDATRVAIRADALRDDRGAQAAAQVAARDAARDAVMALSVRDLIGSDQHGFTQEHYDTLVGPWESVMGTEWTRETL